MVIFISSSVISVSVDGRQEEAASGGLLDMVHTLAEHAHPSAVQARYETRAMAHSRRVWRMHWQQPPHICLELQQIKDEGCCFQHQAQEEKHQAQEQEHQAEPTSSSASASSSPSSSLQSEQGHQAQEEEHSAGVQRTEHRQQQQQRQQQRQQDRERGGRARCKRRGRKGSGGEGEEAEAEEGTCAWSG
eukprot:CAMPEP_0181327264 /NCGR_PEP_ID=MMETSP1101-20121128/21996_1 /TAXON_ID=46948 /ORGANISM="Rhodomonas abbreviata, Strain Caron Lab Isolate" /LENGTH=188 /DNA_ID=CAMNT_0023435887 /DNA_START=54 /DNA_END=619 /DNA_ORIENTATION=+